MSLEGRVRERLGKKRKDPQYQAERLSLEVTEELARLMTEQGVTKADLARRLGVSKARVTHLLNGTPNMTLKTIAAAAVALEAEVSLELRAPTSADDWKFISRIEMPVIEVIADAPERTQRKPRKRPGKAKRAKSQS